MSADWHWDPERLRADLEALGYDVDAADPALAEGCGRLSARRDTGSRSHVLVVDAGGRFRAVETVVLDESGRSAEVAGIAVRLVTEVRRSTTIVGTLAASDQLPALLAFLDNRRGSRGEPGATPR